MTGFHVLAAVSDSASAEEVARFASALATHQDATVTLLHVMDGLHAFPLDSQGHTLASTYQENLERAQELLSLTAAMVNAPHVEQIIESGSVADVICAEAEERGADVIVLGNETQGHEPSVFGSVQERLRKICQRRVVVVGQTG